MSACGSAARGRQVSNVPGATVHPDGRVVVETRAGACADEAGPPALTMEYCDADGIILRQEANKACPAASPPGAGRGGGRAEQATAHCCAPCF